MLKSQRQWPETQEMKGGAAGSGGWGGLGVVARVEGLAGGSRSIQRFCESRNKAVNVLPLSPFNDAAV